MLLHLERIHLFSRAIFPPENSFQKVDEYPPGGYIPVKWDSLFHTKLINMHGYFSTLVKLVTINYFEKSFT